MALYYKCSPIDLDLEQIQDYLLVLKEHQQPSESYFKHTIYGLKFAYRLTGKDDQALKLPSMKGSNKLPVVLSQPEIKLLLKTPKLLKHRIIIALMYDCGLRLKELIRLEWKDIDLDRMRLHVRQGKYNKDRYVEFSSILKRGLITYRQNCVCFKYVINASSSSINNPKPSSARGIQWAIRQAVRKSGIEKKASAHTLRHSYATHLLEMGLDIVSIKDLLGHESIMTTMNYLNIAQLETCQRFAPMDKLYLK